MDKKNFSVVPKDKKKTLEQFFRYFELSSLLFNRQSEEIYNVSDIPPGNKFCKMAQEVSAQLGIDWNNMSHADSNRVMLAMLEDAFNLIREIENSKNIIIKTTIKIIKPNE